MTKCLKMSYNESNLTSVLQSVFGYEKFKNDVQKEATIAISKGARYVCISMPPRFGRSLCFQLPVVLQKGKVAIVFSPKLSFVKNDIDFLTNKQIHARLLSQSTYINERKVILRDLMSNCPTIQLLYVTPEMAMITYFQKLILLLKKHKILSYIVFNDAHCLSEWGYEYTPSYKNINLFDKIYGYVPRVAITTTVTNKVIEDICQLLTLRTPRIFKIPVQQINVYHDVWLLDVLSNPLEHLKSFIVEVLGFLDPSVHKTRKGHAIVYCREEIIGESIKCKLIAFGIPALTCHHKLNNRSRRNVENEWISGKASVIITTYDYGFIHKKPIRCIVYWTVPENISKYYRKSAEACIDNSRAYCRIYFSTKEYSSIKMLIENHRIMNDPEHIKKRLSEYNKLVSYCLSVKCRHAMISAYFGRVIEPCKINCDVCENKEMVEIRTFKFIMYSKSIENITYNLCDIKGHSEKEQSHGDKEESEKSAGMEFGECKITRRGILADKINNGTIVQYTDKQKSSSADGWLFAKDCIQAGTLKRAKDNLNVATGASRPTITSSLPAERNSNKEISLEPCSSKTSVPRNSAGINSAQVSRRGSESKRESRIRDANSDAVRTVAKEDRISRSDSGEVIVVAVNKRCEKRSNHAAAMDNTCSLEFQSKKRKFGTENKAIAATRPRDKRWGTSDRDERVKDDANESVSRGYATAEYLMNKYKLNRDAITLKPCRK